MIHFEQTLPVARDLLAAAGVLAFVEEVLVLRDLRGRIRLFLKPKQGHEKTLADRIVLVAVELSVKLAPFWGGVIDIDSPQSSFFKILENVRGERMPFQDWPSDWSIIERHVSKSAWTSLPHQPPWPLNPRTPPIVAWYSHKGGVGRTTALCAAAIHLAHQGRRVIVLDMDLEAPGLSSVLAPAAAEHGVLDYLLERTAAGPSFHADIEEYVTRQSDPALIGDGGEPILCVSAGVVDEHYLEKLARLDYELLSEQNGAAPRPLAGLLLQLKGQFDPEYMFLDCRAGLHDLGGLAVHVLSHASVVFGLDSRQSWQGLSCLIRRLGQIDGATPPCLVVQAMEEGAPGPRRDDARRRFLEHSYQVFCSEFYDEGDVPDIGDNGAPHNPFPLAYDPRVAGYQSLVDASEILLKPPYADLFTRFNDLVGKARSHGTDE